MSSSGPETVDEDVNDGPTRNGYNPYTINQKRFYSKLERFYEEWSSNRDQLRDLSSILVATGKIYGKESKSAKFHDWLFGFHFNDVILLFTRQKICILTWYNEAFTFYEPVINSHPIGGIPPIEIIKSSPSDDHEEGVEKHFKILEAVGGSVGILPDIIHEHELSKINSKWNDKFYKSELLKFVISESISRIFSVKDQFEIDSVKNGGIVSVKSWKLARRMLFDVVYHKRKWDHFNFGIEMLKVLESPIVLKSIEGEKRKPINTIPIIMSGWEYKLNAEFGKYQNSLENIDVNYGPIIFTLSTRAWPIEILSDITRTVLVNPSSQLKSYYQWVLKLEQVVIDALVPGKTLGEVYETGRNFARWECPDLLNHVKNDFGHCISHSLVKNQFHIVEGNHEKVLPGMVFSVYIGLQNILETERKPAAIAVSDIVIIKEAGKNEITTVNASSDIGSIAIDTKILNIFCFDILKIFTHREIWRRRRHGIMMQSLENTSQFAINDDPTPRKWFGRSRRSRRMYSPVVDIEGLELRCQQIFEENNRWMESYKNSCHYSYL